MQKRHKELLRPLVGKLRRMLAGGYEGKHNDSVVRGNLDRELERLGFASDGTITPLDALPNPTPHERRAYHVAQVQLSGLPMEKRKLARIELVERAAYSWINRLLALRAMEARGLIDETLRPNPEYEGLSEALFVLRQTAPQRTNGADGGWWAVLEDACAAQAQSLPGLFGDDPDLSLRPDHQTLLSCIKLVGAGLPGFSLDEVDAAFADPDAIGWAYQFYQEEAKTQTYARLNSGAKVTTRAEIAAVTQLFTEPYMVQWLLQNSLGRSYHELYPASNLPSSWAYYIQPDTQQSATTPSPGATELATLTLIDPCMGSGHFLREAFDMFVAMYREQQPDLAVVTIVDRVLSRHLHGIDLDPRAAQLAALTLYLRAWELVRDEELRLRRPQSAYHPPAMNLASTPNNIGPGALERHLARHPQDRVIKALLESIFAELEQADILGSLLQPGEKLDYAINSLKGSYNIQLDFDPEMAELRKNLAELADRDPAELKRTLMERITKSFQADAGDNSDVSAALFGREAEQGVRLLKLLDSRYAVVATNPPYMGSGNMATNLRKYVEQHYKAGKRDLYAAFILRCLKLCRVNGRVAMITQQSWMFLHDYTELRALVGEKLTEQHKKQIFKGLLREVELESLAHLGTNAFEEISGEVVQSAMFVLSNQKPLHDFQITAFKLVGFKASIEKAEKLVNGSKSNVSYRHQPYQVTFTSILDSPICYWLDNSLLLRLAKQINLSSIFLVKGGLSTTDNERFVRFNWEVDSSRRWYSYTKGGGYGKWAGNDFFLVEWAYVGARMKSYIITIPGNNHWSRRIFNSEFYFQSGFTYTSIAGRKLGIRKIDANHILGHAGPGIFPIDNKINVEVAGIFNTRLATYLLRAISSKISFEVNHLLSLPKYDENAQLETVIAEITSFCILTKELIIQQNPLEKLYNLEIEKKYNFDFVALLLSICEAALEKISLLAYNLNVNSINSIIEDTGVPPGWHPLIVGYDSLPQLLSELDLPPIPAEVLEYFDHQQRISVDTHELARIKNQLRALYEAGPGAKNLEEMATNPSDDEGDKGEEEGFVSGAHIPIPTETFLEELSVKLQIHPVSVYWLLEELRNEGVRCKPEELRLLEDRLSVLVLRLLGHRWPKQLEAGEAVPYWAEKGGLIPLSVGTGETTLAERVRVRLLAEVGELEAQRTEALLDELTGLRLEDWLRKSFFQRHVRQFKYRPIAWHLASNPQSLSGIVSKKRGGIGGRRNPAFECLLYYHATPGDTLARIRTHFVEPVLRSERRKVEEALKAGNESEAALATDRVHELETFVEKLRHVEEEGFACPELDKLLATEPLDRWSGDGYEKPSNSEKLLQNERAWHVDINDGVRVNIAPVQLAGLLAGNVEVLKAADAKKAIADRTRWRSDERRWVREGKLPRCGWMEESVPESSRWTELAPQRASEQLKLEQKRKSLESL